MPAPAEDSTSLAVPYSCDLAHPRRPRPIPDLDADVLEAICSSIDGVYDLLVMSQTCSLMWRIATREVLRARTIHLTRSESIRTFRTFILNHKAAHAHHVRSLVISGSVYYIAATLLSDDSTRVMDILGCTVELESLHLSFTNKFHAQPARIVSVFAGLSSLTSLSLVDPGRRWAHYALSALQAPLRTLSVSMERESLVHPSVPPSQCFQTILRFSTLSILTSLRLDQVPMYDNSWYDLPQFRSVRSLTITVPLEREPRLAALLHLFPSLDESLYLRQDFRTRAELFMDPRRLHEIREENRRAQDVSRWTRLDRLDCHAEIAGMLALQCPVGRLTINTLNLEVIRDVQPRHLVLAPLQLPFYIALSKPSRAHAAHPYLTHLVFISSFHSNDYFDGKLSMVFPQTSALRADVAFERLVQTICLFESATHVRLVFYYNKEGSCKDELEGFMRDVRAHASEPVGSRFAPPPHLLAACPQLRYFFVTAAGRDNAPDALPSQRRWNYARAWRVAEPGEDGQWLGEGGRSEQLLGTARIVEELRDSAAKRVIEAEDLGLPEEWERKLELCRAL